MAALDYNPVPTAEARDQAPDDLQHVEAGPNSFGAAVAQGVDQLAAGVDQGLHFYNQVSADNATNNLITQATNILHGDASSPAKGPDGNPIIDQSTGQPVPDTGYFGKRGADAMAARGDVMSSLDETIKQARESLHTPQAQLQFDNDSRRMRAQWQAQVGEHADREQMTYALDTASMSGQLGLNDVGRSPSDDAIVAQARERVRGAYFKVAQIKGENPAMALVKANQDVAFTQIRSLLNTNPLAAKSALEKNMNILAGLPGTYGIQREINGAAQDYLVGTLSDPALVEAARAKFTAEPGAGVPQHVGFADVQRAILSQESGNNPGIGDSVDGARGVGQIVPDTFRRFARPGEDINNPADNRAVANRMIQQFYVKYNGDPAKIATAYFSGEGNVAQSGAAAWKADHTDGNGKSVSSYVSDIKARLGVTGAAAGDGGDPDQAYLLHVRQQAQNAGLDPNAVENVVKRVEVNIRRDDTEKYNTVAGTAKDVVDYLTNGGDPAKVTMTPQQITQQVPGQKGKDLADSLTVALDYNKAYHQIATASDQQVQAILEAHKPTGPDDYAKKGAAYDYLVQAAQARQKAIYGNGKDTPGDPAQYLQQTNPDMGKAYAAAFTSPQAFSAYVSKAKATFDALGIPAGSQRILTNDTARSIIGNLQTKPPADALKQLMGLSQEAGSSWQLVYRDLARAGLPSTFQTALAVADRSTNDAQTIIDAIQHDAHQRGQGKPVMDEVAQGMTVNYRGANVTLSKAVNDTINADPNLVALRQSMGVAGRAGLDQYLGVEQAVRQTALYLYLNGRANDPAAAATQATRMLTDKYDFVAQPGHPPARIPRGSADDFRAAAAQTLHGLKPGDVRPYQVQMGQHGEALVHPENERAYDAYQGAQHAYWVTVPGPDGENAVQAIDPTSGRPVILKNGSTITIPVAQFKVLAQRYRAQPKSPPDFVSWHGG